MSKNCKEEFRHMARWLSRVTPEFCVRVPSKSGKIIEEYMSYYDEVDWKLGQYYLIKCIFKTMTEQFTRYRQAPSNDNIPKNRRQSPFVHYLEDNLPYDVLKELYSKIRDVMLKQPCCGRHCMWSKGRYGWPYDLDEAVEIQTNECEKVYENMRDDEVEEDFSESTDNEYWNSYDRYEDMIESNRSYIDNMILSTEDL